MFVTGGAKWWLAVQSIHSWPGGRGSYYASHSNKLKQMVGVNKLKQMVGVAINTYLVAVAQRELEYHLVTLLCSRWASRAELLRMGHALLIRP